MTNEEAIEKIQAIIDDDGGLELDEEEIKALELAIAALEGSGDEH